MSSFGFGGFGNQQQQPQQPQQQHQPQQQQQQQQQQFGSPFGGFNSNSNVKLDGKPQNPAFGSSAYQNPTFGNSNATFVSNNANINQNSSFGSSSNNATFGVMASPGITTSSFGVNANASPFGSNSVQNNSSNFGTSTSTSNQNASFAPSPFSAPNNDMSSNNKFTATTFGGGVSTTGASSFGSNTAATAFGASSPPATISNNPFSSPNTATSTFNAPSSATNAIPFSSAPSFTGNQQQQHGSILFGSSTNVMESDGNQDQNDANMDNQEQQQIKQTQTSPFGSSTNAIFGIPNQQGKQNYSSKNEMEDDEQNNDDNHEESTSSTTVKDLATLRAKIQEKKKRLEEQKTKLNNHSNDDTATPNTPAFATLKFSSYLPEDLREKLQEGKLPKKNEDDDRTNEEEGGLMLSNDNIATSSSLLGTCKTMCPEDEILQRTIENDIQSYEVPSTINPNHTDWSLRDTCIKRFRRSAADYTLNVAQLIRPPFVLEKTMGYMEEWIMELDRRNQQEPKFQPLDVYQFLWDRTRMIRKDFILQNYISGPMGKCSSVAVRVHERIARWHIMMEHQLSHVQEFVTFQSSLNIQELGQAMKTLNMYYDDSADRSSALEKGEEKNVIQGCQYHRVQGDCELVDYDGTTTLNNNSPSKSSDSTDGTIHRLIGIDSKSHGTSEAEMRGLYILLTMDNDSGMEVVKYASQLYQDKPSIYHSSHVQLALKIFQIKKDHNYAKFFSILRNPTTPYLYSCLMFKYVEAMRKLAFRVMSRAFGARRKDTGESMYDSYPLQDLVHLLCFENEKEAKKACDHYNIKVKQNKEDGRIIIYWRHSDYCEPTDPKKEGVRLSLKSWKMNRTIECKLKGATRLMVCRGDLCGYDMLPSSGSDTVSEEDKQLLIQQERERLAEEKKREYKKMLQEKIRIEQEKMIKIQEEERHRKEQDRLKQEAEQERQRKAQEEQRLRKEEEQKRLLQEIELRKKQQYELKQEEQRRRLEEERRREEQERLKQEAEQERQRKAQEEQRLRKEEEQRRRLQEIELRKKQQHELLLQKERERKIKVMIEEEKKEKRKEEEWNKTINNAKLQLMLRKWRHLVQESYYTKYSTKKNLLCIDPTKKHQSSKTIIGSIMTPTKNKKVSLCTANINSSQLLMKLNNKLNRLHDIFLCCSQIGETINLSSKLMALMHDQILSKSNYLTRDTASNNFRSENNRSKIVILCKVLVIVPSSIDNDNNQYDVIQTIIQSWLNEKLSTNNIQKENMLVENLFIDIRLVTTLCCSTTPSDNIDTKTADLILYLVPPLLGSNSKSYSFSETPLILEDIPRIVLVLTESNDLVRPNPNIMKLIDSALGKDENMNTLEQSLSRSGVIKVDFTLEESSCPLINLSLTSCCEALLKAFIQDHIQIGNNNDAPLLYTSPYQMEFINVESLGRSCILGLLQRFYSRSINVDRDSFADFCHEVLDAFSEVLNAFVSEIWKYGTDDVPGSGFTSWPSESFADGVFNEELLVLNYFGDDKVLPINWVKKLLSRTKIEQALSDAFPFYHNSDKQSMVTIANQMLQNAPFDLLQRCEILFTKQDLTSFWKGIFSWQEEMERHDKDNSIYLPKDIANMIIQRSLDYQWKDMKVNLVFPHLIVPSDVVNTLRKDASNDSAPCKNDSPKKKRAASPTSPLDEDRTKRSRVNVTSKQLEESKRFTELLESYYCGDSTVDLKIGDNSDKDLATILSSRGLDIEMI